MPNSPSPSQRNSFTGLRLFLALVVLVDHVREASNIWFPIDLGWFPPGTLALFGFFAISGFLVTPGLLSNGFTYFLRRRVARIFPGWWALHLSTLFVFATIWQVQAGKWVIGWSEGVRYLGANLFPLPEAADAPTSSWNLLAGLPLNVPLKGNPNVSLWSLALELFCYLGLALAYLSFVKTQLSFRWAISSSLVLLWICGVYVSLSQVHAWVRIESFQQAIIHKWPYLLAFLTGVTIRLWETEIKLHLPGWWLLSILLPIAISDIKLWALFGSISFSFLIIKIGISEAPNWLDPRRDLSFGTYLYHFPIHQTVVGFGWGLSPIWLLAISIPASLGFAYLSSRFVEVPISQRINGSKSK